LPRELIRAAAFLLLAIWMIVVLLPIVLQIAARVGI
jgi:hypothetical protein